MNTPGNAIESRSSSIQLDPTGVHNDNATACRELESGGVLYFRETPFEFPAEDQQFLRELRQARGRHHKNIAYHPARNCLSGFRTDFLAGSGSQTDAAQLREVLARYSARVTGFAARLLSPYAPHWRLDYTCVRTIEEHGRVNRLVARNDLLHLDSFPTRPTDGDLILRVFTNFNATESRQWHTGEPFPRSLQQLRGLPGCPAIRPFSGPNERRLRETLAAVGKVVRAPFLRRSPYDQFMLNLHHFMKRSETYQATGVERAWSFAPGSSWICFTDVVPHAVLSGQFAIEQTFIVSRRSLVAPELCPAAILQRQCGGLITFSGSPLPAL